MPNRSKRRRRLVSCWRVRLLLRLQQHRRRLKAPHLLVRKLLPLRRWSRQLLRRREESPSAACGVVVYLPRSERRGQMLLAEGQRAAVGLRGGILQRRGSHWEGSLREAADARSDEASLRELRHLQHGLLLLRRAGLHVRRHGNDELCEMQRRGLLLLGRGHRVHGRHLHRRGRVRGKHAILLRRRLLVVLGLRRGGERVIRRSGRRLPAACGGWGLPLVARAALGLRRLLLPPRLSSTAAPVTAGVAGRRVLRAHADSLPSLIWRRSGGARPRRPSPTLPLRAPAAVVLVPA